MNLRIHTSKSVKETIHYHTGRKSQEAYYSTDGQEFSGFWGGKGAELLGLKGCVTDEAFAQLCRNLHPLTGEQLKPRMLSNGRIGFDVTISPPKSVSLLYAWTKDERILWAHRQAIHDTLTDMQEKAAARIRAGGVNEGDRVTGNLVWAEIIHLTARPVKGLPDPHLHSHCYVFNVTWDAKETKWKALQMGLIHDEADSYNRIVTKRLMENLQSLGLEIIPTKDAFEIAGISRELIEKFSRRTQTIKEYAEHHGITDPEQKAKLAALTRESKAKSLLISELEPFWWGNLLPEERKALEAAQTLLQRSRAAELSRQMVGERAATTKVAFDSSDKLGTRDTLPVVKTKAASSEFLGTQSKVKTAKSERRISLNQRTRPVTAESKEAVVTEYDRRAVALAIEHLFARESVITETKLIAEATHNWCADKTTLAGIKQAVAEAPLLRRELNGKMMVTTSEVWAEEMRIADRCYNGLGRWTPMNKFWQIVDERLNEQQRQAVQHVLNSEDLVVGIKGKAGTGKTTLLQELRRGMEAGFNKLMVFAPGSEAARDVLRNEGFKEAETVAQLLVNERLQKMALGAVWLVDEAGLISNRQMDQLMALAAKLGSRLVLVGDPDQHHSVERGQAFEHLEKEGKMKVATVNEIMRQQGIYKQIVEYSAARDNDSAIELMKQNHDIIEVPHEEMFQLAAKRYATALKRGEKVLVVSPTHKECEQVTEAIRAELRSQNILRGGIEWPVLKNQQWSDAEKSDPEKYSNGLVVQINRHVKGFALGEQVEVVSADDDCVRVRSKECNQSPRIKMLPLEQPESFCVYKPGTIEICEGELLRVTCNGRNKEGHRLSNGNWIKVDMIKPDGRLVLENGWYLDNSFKHLDYRYPSTSHSAQGKSVDRVILVQSADATAAANTNQFYVSISRGKRSVFVITDDIEQLKENVSVDRRRMMATELMQASEEAQDERKDGLKQVLGNQTEVRWPSQIFQHFGIPIDVALSDKLGMAESNTLAMEAELTKQMQAKKARELELADEMELVM